MSEVNDELMGNPLRWVASAREDMLGFRRLEPGGSGSENPRAQGKPRAEGEKVSHELPSCPDGDSEARSNHESGKW